jgi:hypothetical protein
LPETLPPCKKFRCSLAALKSDIHLFS